MANDAPVIPTEELPTLVLPIGEEDHHIGPLTARSSLVEYGDFECEHCLQAYAIAKELVRELEDDLCYVFRQFPQSDVHPRALRAAEVAEAAGMQAKFWLMHDRLFEHRYDLSEKELQQLARALPLEMDTFERDLSSGAAARRVTDDLESGRAAGVEETPTFFVNGRLYVGSYEFLPLLAALRATSSNRSTADRT